MNMPSWPSPLSPSKWERGEIYFWNYFWKYIETTNKISPSKSIWWNMVRLKQKRHKLIFLGSTRLLTASGRKQPQTWPKSTKRQEFEKIDICQNKNIQPAYMAIAYGIWTSKRPRPCYYQNLELFIVGLLPPTSTTRGLQRHFAQTRGDVSSATRVKS